MEAKEMFEKLGYTKKDTNNYIQYDKPFKREYTYMMKRCVTIGVRIINFHNGYEGKKDYKLHEENSPNINMCYHERYNHNVEIELEEHKAIHQQLIELGWL